MAEEANSETSEPLPKRRKRDKDNDELADGMRDAMKHLCSITALLTKNDDEFELFGKSVALQLKKMSVCTALAVQAKIQQLLSQYRINEIQKMNKEGLCDGSTQMERVGESGQSRAEKITTLEEQQLKSPSPQLSLTCDHSNSSENDTTEVG